MKICPFNHFITLKQFVSETNYFWYKFTVRFCGFLDFETIVALLWSSFDGEGLNLNK